MTGSIMLARLCGQTGRPRIRGHNRSIEWRLRRPRAALGNRWPDRDSRTEAEIAARQPPSCIVAIKRNDGTWRCSAPPVVRVELRSIERAAISAYTQKLELCAAG